MKSADIQKKLYEIVGSEIPTQNIQRDCMYLSKEKDRFCRQTSQKSCKGCKFFEPNIRTKINMVIETINRMETEHKLAMAKLKSDCEKRMKWMMDQHDRECLVLEEEIEFYRTGGTAPMFKKEKKHGK